MFKQNLSFAMIALLGASISNAQFAPGSSTSSSAAAPGAGQTAVKVEEAKKTETRKVFGEIYNRYDISMADINRRTGTPSMPNYLGVRYVFNPNQQVSLRQAFSLDGSSEKVKSKLEDTYVHYGHKNIVKWGETGSLNLATGRIYAPTGETSREDTGRKSRVLAWITANGALGPFDVVYHQVHDYHLHSKDISTKGNPNMGYNLYNSVEVGKEVAKGFSLSVENALDQYFFRGTKPGDASSTPYTQSYQLIFNAEYSLKPFVFAVSLTDDIKTHNREEAFQLFREKDMSYKFLITATL